MTVTWRHDFLAAVSDRIVVARLGILQRKVILVNKNTKSKNWKRLHSKMSSSNHDTPSSDSDPAEVNNIQPDSSSVSDGVTPTRLLKMKEIMENQCFEMNVKVKMGKHKESHEAETDLSKNESAIEQARLSYFNKTLVLNRMQIWNAIIEKIQNDADAEALKELTSQNTELCEKTMKIIKETRELQDQITDIQKERLDLKGQIKKKMLEINDLKQVKENQGDVQQKAKERAEVVLQKYQKVTTILQNVLRGIILASKVNWRDDPKLRDIAMGLENVPN